MLQRVEVMISLAACGSTASSAPSDDAAATDDSEAAAAGTDSIPILG